MDSTNLNPNNDKLFGFIKFQKTFNSNLLNDFNKNYNNLHYRILTEIEYRKMIEQDISNIKNQIFNLQMYILFLYGIIVFLFFTFCLIKF